MRICCRDSLRLEPFPQVVGITVHLTFARRAYELARWFRERGATVIFGGLHVLSCPEEAAPHADALAIGDGVQLWPSILKDIAAWQIGDGFIERISPGLIAMIRRRVATCCPGTAF